MMPGMSQHFEIGVFTFGDHGPDFATGAAPLAVTGHAFVAPTSPEAADVAFPPHAAVMGRICRERGWPPMTRAQFDAARDRAAGDRGGAAGAGGRRVGLNAVDHGTPRCDHGMTTMW